MSQATASLPSTRRAPAERERRSAHLEALPRAAQRGRPKLFYAAIAVLTVMTVVLTQLLLSIGVSQGAYRIESLQSSKAQLAREYQQASEQVQTLSSPQNLAANAAALGMVPDATPVFLRLSDDAVIGSPAPASAGAGASAPTVANALTQDIPLVTAPKSSKKPATSSVTGTSDPSASAQANGSGATTTGSGTPGSNDQQADSGPVPWTGALPAPSTH